jgi:predicted DNA-binding transcriptional regulator AlpA
VNYKSEIDSVLDGDRVLTLAQWYTLNGFSRATAQRLIARGKGPRLIQLSERRIGIRLCDHREWQTSRLIDPAA